MGHKELTGLARAKNDRAGMFFNGIFSVLKCFHQKCALLKFGRYKMFI